MIKVYVWHC